MIPNKLIACLPAYQLWCNTPQSCKDIFMDKDGKCSHFIDIDEMCKVSVGPIVQFSRNLDTSIERADDPIEVLPMEPADNTPWACHWIYSKYVPLIMNIYLFQSSINGSKNPNALTVNLFNFFFKRAIQLKFNVIDPQFS